MYLKIKDMNYKVYFQGQVNEHKIKLFYSPKEKFFTERAEEIIKERWAIREKEGAYDGNLIELIDCIECDGCLKLYFDYTKYRFSLVARDAEYQKENCYLSNHISIPTVIKTVDNKFILISSGKILKGKCSWKFVGGYWEKEAPTICDNVLKEIEEEVGLSKFVNNLKIIGISERDYSTCISTVVDCSLLSSEIQSYIEKNRENIVDSYEAGEIKFFDLSKKSINNILNDDSISLGGMTVFTLDSLYKIL